jgi:outer membrane protein assembly factor BamB
MFATSTAETVFVSGYAPSVACCTDIFVRAYKASDGRILWTDYSNKGRDDLPQSIAADSTAVIVVGYGGNTTSPPISALDFLVRALNPATGALLWEDRVDRGFLSDDIAWVTKIDRGRAFVAGTSGIPSDDRPDLLLRAYDLGTGTLLWEASRPRTLAPFGIFVEQDRLYVSGPGYLLPFDMYTGDVVGTPSSS